jgi:hypothetical protein
MTNPKPISFSFWNRIEEALNKNYMGIWPAILSSIYESYPEVRRFSATFTLNYSLVRYTDFGSYIARALRSYPHLSCLLGSIYKGLICLTGITSLYMQQGLKCLCWLGRQAGKVDGKQGQLCVSSVSREIVDNTLTFAVLLLDLCPTVCESAIINIVSPAA